MILENLATKGISYPDSEDLLETVSIWCNTFLNRSSPQSNSTISRPKLPTSYLSREIRKNPAEFSKWIQEKNYFALFFDGASKGNLGVAGAGNILLDPEGQTGKKNCLGDGPQEEQ